MMQVPRRVLDFWEAVDRVDPLPDSWRQTAKLCSVTDQLISVELARGGGEWEPRSAEDFMPPQWTRPPEELPRQQTAEEQLAVLNAGMMKRLNVK
jgi:hypothetical protein